jgi:hypothetical protein
MLLGKYILLLGNGEDSTSELGLKLSLHGGIVFVIGKNEAVLAQLQHEVYDAGGRLSYYIVDSDDPITALQVSAHVQAAGDTCYALVDNTGQSDHRYKRALLEIFEHSSELTLPEHIITINHANGDPDHTFAPPDESKAVVIDTDISDGALPGAQDELPKATELYSAILAREVVYALGHKTYHAVNRIALINDGNNILARLYKGSSSPVKTIRRGRTPQVYVAHTKMGRAVFAGCDFKRGDLIFETNGTRLAHQTEHTIQIDWDFHLEPDSPIRLINHSCDPNVGVKTNPNGLPDFYAFRDIQQGEELNFDYAMTEYRHYPRADEALEFSLECRCGSPNCRGKLGYYSELSAATKQRYEGFVSAYFATPRPCAAHLAKTATMIGIHSDINQ